MRNKGIYLPLIISTAVTLLISIIICIGYSWKCAAAVFVCGAFVEVIFVVYTKSRYKKIEELNSYLELVCSGQYSLDISSNSEGELSVLKNNLYKVILLLRSSNEALAADKVYLADSLADISHQLKTPLTSIMVMTDLIKAEQDIEKIHSFSSIVELQSEKMKWLISTLLKLSRLDAKTADFKNDNVNISDVIRDSVNPFLITADLKGVTIEQSINDFVFCGDKSWTTEAFQNIIKNCLEHTDKNGTIKISTNTTTIYNEVVIEDNGCGIDEADLPHIFERFYHCASSSPDSVGIGLALSKSIFENEKARISASSVKGEGSSFSVKFYKSIL